MKKYLLALVALLVVATGCGNTKKLECSTEIQGLHQDVVAEYDGEDIKSIKMIMTYDAATLKSFGVTDSNRELFVSEMESEVCDAYNAPELYFQLCSTRSSDSVKETVYYA